MSVIMLPSETVSFDSEDDDIILDHVSCHCTDHKLAACRTDVSDIPLEEGFWEESVNPCVMCVTEWPVGSPTCPWGCSCEEECGPEFDEE